MFTVTKEPLSWIDVEWPGLDADGFSTTNSIRMKVAFLPTTEMQNLFGNEGQEETADLVKRVGRDWGNIQGEGGVAFPFTPDNVDTLVEHVPNFARGFQASYVQAWLGQGKEREKNSAGSPVDGRADEAAGTKPAPPSS